VIRVVALEGNVGADPVPSLDLLLNRFPSHELAIRRLYRRDPEFRAVCDDYREVQRALQHWQAADRAAPERVAEYRQMLDELAAEALAFLHSSAGR
jgi:outer membrane protein assembly factor BamD (BamD/ComL family)